MTATAVFDYDQETLNHMARTAVQDKGIYVGWAVRVTAEGVSLVVKYQKMKHWASASLFEDHELNVAL